MSLLLAPKVAPERPAFGDVALRGTDVSVDLGGQRIVSGIDIEIRAGEIVALVGPNGAGKSTLLAALAGDLGYSGSVELDGRQAAKWSSAELALRRAVLRQDNIVTFPFKVIEIVAMGRAPWQRITSPREDERIIGEELVRTDSLQFADRTFGSLSGGERARVSLARVLAQRTGLIFLDEPTAALDVNYQELVLATARRVAREGAAVCIVLHDLAAAAAYADRVVLLSHGSCIAHGTPAEVFDSETLSSVYAHPIRVLQQPAADGGTELHIVPERYADTSAATTAPADLGGSTLEDQ